MTRSFLTKTVLPLAALALFAAPAAVQLHAQAPAGGGMGGGGGQRQQQTPQQQVDRLDTALTLTPEQKAKILTIYTDAKVKNDAMNADASMDADAKRTKMMDMRTAQTASIKALLTDDQKTKFDAMNQRGGGRQGGGGQGGGAGAPPPGQ